MMKELYGTSMIKYENKEEVLEYYMLNSEDENKENKENKMKIYGIEIIKKSANSEETSFVSDLTINKEFAEEILKTIKNNMVTPVHLYDVLENFL